MDTVTVSPKFQIVIPKPVRERAGIVPGEKFQVLSFDDRIELVRMQPMSRMRGFLNLNSAVRAAFPAQAMDPIDFMDPMDLTRRVKHFFRPFRP